MGEWLSVPAAEAIIEQRVGRGALIRESGTGDIDNPHAELEVQHDAAESYYNLLDVQSTEVRDDPNKRYQD